MHSLKIGSATLIALLSIVSPAAIKPETAMSYAEPAIPDLLNSSSSRCLFSKVGSYIDCNRKSEFAQHNSYIADTELDKIDELFSQVVQILNRIEDNPAKVRALATIAAKYAKAGQAERANQLFSQAEQAAGNNTILLANVAGNYVVARRFDKAIQLANAIQDNEQKAGLLGLITEQYAISGQYSQAIQVANTISNPEQRAIVLANIAIQSAKSGQVAQSEKTLSQVLQVINTINNNIRRESLLGEILQYYAATGQFKPAMQLAGLIRQDVSKAAGLNFIAKQYVKVGKLDEALTLYKTILNTTQDGFMKQETLANIARLYVEAGRLEQALQVVNNLDRNDKKTNPLTQIAIILNKNNILADIASKYAASGQKVKAAAVLAPLLENAEKVQVPKKQDLELNRLVMNYANAGLFEQALQIAQKIHNNDDKLNAILRVASSYVKFNQYDQAFQLLKRLSGDNDSALKIQSLSLLKPIALYYEKTGHSEQLNATMSLIKDDTLKAGVLGEIASYYVASQQKDKAAQILTQALTHTQKIQDNDFFKAFILSTLAVQYAALGEDNQARAIANTINPESSKDVKAIVLADIAKQYIANGQKNKAVEVLRQALQVAETISEKQQSSVDESFTKIEVLFKIVDVILAAARTPVQ